MAGQRIGGSTVGESKGQEPHQGSATPFGAALRPLVEYNCYQDSLASAHGVYESCGALIAAMLLATLLIMHPWTGKDRWAPGAISCIDIGR